MKRNKKLKEDVEFDLREEQIRNKSQSNKIIPAIIVCFVLLVILLTFVFLIMTSRKSNSTNESKDSKEENNIQLKYTDSVTTKSEGVYITDVSEIVDEVMPSIVAITSKTVINSGNFGPSFYRNGSYTTEGAGSGVIVAESDSEIFILTNYHVVEDTTELSVKFVDEKSYDATVKGVSERKDIAIVSVKKKDVDKDTLEKIEIATISKQTINPFL